MNESGLWAQHGWAEGWEELLFGVFAGGTALDGERAGGMGTLVGGAPKSGCSSSNGRELAWLSPLEGRLAPKACLCPSICCKVCQHRSSQS